MSKFLSWWFSPRNCVIFSFSSVVILAIYVFTDSGDGFDRGLWAFNAIIYAVYAYIKSGLLAEDVESGNNDDS